MGSMQDRLTFLTLIVYLNALLSYLHTLNTYVCVSLTDFCLLTPLIKKLIIKKLLSKQEIELD